MSGADKTFDLSRTRMGDPLEARYDDKTGHVFLYASDSHEVSAAMLSPDEMDALCAWWGKVLSPKPTLDHARIRCEYGGPVTCIWIENFDSGIHYPAYEVAIIHPDTGADIAAWRLNEFGHIRVPGEEWRSKMGGHMRVIFRCRLRNAPKGGFLSSEIKEGRA